MCAAPAKDGKKSTKDSKPDGKKDGEKTPHVSISRGNKDQIVKDVKDAIKDVKDALKEYRREAPSKKPSVVVKEKSQNPSINDKLSDRTSVTVSSVENSHEINAALAVLNDMRVESVLSTKPLQMEEDLNNPAHGEDPPTDLSKSDDEAGLPTSFTTFCGIGSFVFNSSEYVDEYLKQLGVGLVFRKVQSVANPSLTIFPSKANEWGIKMDSIFRTREVKFQLGEEFSDETFDGRPCRSVATIEASDRLYIRQRCPSGPDVKVFYESLHDNSIQMTLNCGSATAVLHFVTNEDI